MGDARCLTAHVLTNCVSRDASAAGCCVPTMMHETDGALGPWPDPHFRTVFVLVLRETVLVLVLLLEAAAGIRVRVPSWRIEYEYESRGNQLQAEIVGDARCVTALGLTHISAPFSYSYSEKRYSYSYSKPPHGFEYEYHPAD